MSLAELHKDGVLKILVQFFGAVGGLRLVVIIDPVVVVVVVVVVVHVVVVGGAFGAPAVKIIVQELPEKNGLFKPGRFSRCLRC